MTGDEKIILYDSDGNSLEYLTQWDLNQTLTISGAITDITPMVHFSNKDSMGALVVLPTVVDSDIVVKIPNYLMQYEYPIIVHLYYEYDDGSSRTEYTTVIPLIARVKPEDFLYEENIEYTNWYERLEGYVDQAKTYAEQAEGSATEAQSLYETMVAERLVAVPVTEEEYENLVADGSVDNKILYIIVGDKE